MLVPQMNFFGTLSSGTSPRVLRYGPFSKLTLRQSPKQTSLVPMMRDVSTLNGYLTGILHFFMHAIVDFLSCSPNLIELNVF